MAHGKHDLVWKLLRCNIAPGQLLGYAVANLVGLVIVIAALQLYIDIRTPDSDGADALMSADYMIVSKKVDGFGSANGATSRFSVAELDDIGRQSWAVKVGQFTASDFNVYATTEFAGSGMSTYLFFESIPDEFIDHLPAQWDFNPEQPFIPIVLSKDYLALYNFGFAASRGLPQISESMVGLIPLRVSLSGNGRQEWFPARVVGFSSRLNTIAVPQQFMDWANARFAERDVQTEPSRLIVKVDNPADPTVKAYLDSHGLEVAGDKASSGRITYILSVLTGIIIAVGLVFTILAGFILLLSLYLLLQKNRQKINDLILLGYTPARLAGYYIRMVAVFNGVVLVAGIAVLFGVRAYWLRSFEPFGLGGGSCLWPVLTAITVMALTTVINAMIIRRRIR